MIWWFRYERGESVLQKKKYGMRKKDRYITDSLLLVEWQECECQ